MVATTYEPRTGGAHARQSRGTAGGTALPTRSSRVGLASAVRSEFTKIRSVRSTYWILLAMIVVCVGIGVLFSAGDASRVSGAVSAADRAAALARARAYGIGGILRHTAGAIAASIGLLFAAWSLSGFLPGPPSGWFGQADIDKWIPFNAGGAIWEHISGVNMFSPWIGFAVFCGYAAVAMTAGLILFLRRDA